MHLLHVDSVDKNWEHITKRIKVSTLEEALTLFRQNHADYYKAGYDTRDLSPKDGNIYEGDEIIAQISPNGRVWEKIGGKEIFLDNKE